MRTIENVDIIYLPLKASHYKLINNKIKQSKLIKNIKKRTNLKYLFSILFK